LDDDRFAKTYPAKESAAMTANQPSVRISFHDHLSLGELFHELPALLRHDGFSVDIETRHLVLLDARVRKAIVGILLSDTRTGECAARINFIDDDETNTEQQLGDLFQAYDKALQRHKELCALIGKTEDQARLLPPTHRIVVAENVTEARVELALRHILEGEDSDYRLVAIAASHLMHIVRNGSTLPAESPGKRLHTLWFGAVDKEAAELLAPHATKEESVPPGCEHATCIELVKASDLERLSTSLSLQPADNQRMLKEIHDKLSKQNGSRRFLLPAPPLEKLRQLREAFPNFSEVVDVLERQVALARLRPQATWNFQPLLLLGAPGIGKTEFARSLAEIIGTRFHAVSMATASAGWILAGSDLTWSSGKPGVVFNLLTQEPFANPVILLDEIDKTGGDRRYDPLGPLYELLEPASATTFKDEATNLPIDASHIQWIATANELNIDAPLLSRLRIIHVPPPDRDQCRTICQRIYAGILHREKLDTHFNSDLSRDVLNKMEATAPREMKALLVAALGTAALQGRRELLFDDIEFQAPGRRSFGFVDLAQ
jgi:ATP-dependent Lon protease